MLAGATVGLNWFMLVGRTTTLSSLFFVGEVIYKADLLSYGMEEGGGITSSSVPYRSYWFMLMGMRTTTCVQHHQFCEYYGELQFLLLLLKSLSTNKPQVIEGGLEIISSSSSSSSS